MDVIPTNALIKVYIALIVSDFCLHVSVIHLPSSGLTSYCQKYVLKYVVVHLISVLRHHKICYLFIQGRLTKSLKSPVVRWNDISCRAVRKSSLHSVIMLNFLQNLKTVERFSLTVEKIKCMKLE